MSNKEFNSILKEFGLTEAELQAIYEDVATTNKLVDNFLYITKLSLREIPPHLLRQLSGQKAKDLERIEKELVEKEAKEAEERRQEEEKLYYQEHFEEIMVEKILNKEKLGKEVLRELIDEYAIETQTTGKGRWTAYKNTIVKILDKTFSIDWQEGLTEYQQSLYDDQPIEVVAQTKEVTITVTEWIPVNKEE